MNLADNIKLYLILGPVIIPEKSCRQIIYFFCNFGPLCKLLYGSLSPLLVFLGRVNSRREEAEGRSKMFGLDQVPRSWNLGKKLFNMWQVLDKQNYRMTLSTVNAEVAILNIKFWPFFHSYFTEYKDSGLRYRYLFVDIFWWKNNHFYP